MCVYIGSKVHGIRPMLQSKDLYAEMYSPARFFIIAHDLPNYSYRSEIGYRFMQHF
jgi:hypothetical protein